MAADRLGYKRRDLGTWLKVLRKSGKRLLIRERDGPGGGRARVARESGEEREPHCVLIRLRTPRTAAAPSCHST